MGLDDASRSEKEIHEIGLGPLYKTIRQYKIVAKDLNAGILSTLALVGIPSA